MLETFEILKTIGNGATSEVFQARLRASGEVVALKRFHQALLGDPAQVERLRSEVDVLKVLNHPNVVGLRGEHFDKGQYWLEIDFVDGCDLRQWIRDYTLPLIEPRLSVLVQIARGLGHAHEQSVIHRDLKPENILVARDGQIRITDFGLARSLERMTMTRLGLLVGSLGYMAPEVINGQKATMKSDLFSFAVLAYEVLTGQPPFNGDSPQVLIRAICEGDFARLSSLGGRIPPTIADVIDACLDKDPLKRPESIWAVEAVLMNHLVTTGVAGMSRELAAPVPGSARVQEALRRKHTQLKNQVALTASRRDLLYLACEVRALYPEDAMLGEIFSKLSSEPKKRSLPWRWIAAAAVLLIALGSAFWLTRPAPQAPAAAVAPAVGHIRFDVDPSIEVKVNGAVVPAAERAHFAQAPGVHKLTMTKDGFDPIEGEVEVTAGQTTTIRAGQ